MFFYLCLFLFKSLLQLVSKRCGWDSEILFAVCVSGCVLAAVIFCPDWVKLNHPFCLCWEFWPVVTSRSRSLRAIALWCTRQINAQLIRSTGRLSPRGSSVHVPCGRSLANHRAGMRGNFGLSFESPKYVQDVVFFSTNGGSFSCLLCHLMTDENFLLGRHFRNICATIWIFFSWRKMGKKKHTPNKIYQNEPNQTKSNWIG